MATSDSPLYVPNVTLAVARNENSNGDPISGGTAALSWSAPNGLADKQTITIETDGTYDFGLGPTKFITSGFGAGWLYSASIDSTMPGSPTCPFSGEQWHYEFGAKTAGARRLAAEANGIRCTSYPQTITEADDIAGNSDYGLGMISWDTGSDIPEGVAVFCSHWVKRDISGGGDADAIGQTQYKTFRHTSGLYPDSSPDILLLNAIFPNRFTEGTVSVTNGSAVVTGVGTAFSSFRSGMFIRLAGEAQVRYVDSITDGTSLTLSQPYDGATQSGLSYELLRPGPAKIGGFDPHSNGANSYMDSEWVREDLELTMNTVDVANGTMLSRVWQPYLGGRTEVFPTDDNEPQTGDGQVLFYSTGSPRMRWLGEQSFLNNTLGTVDIKQTDVFMQIGSHARFELANAATPDTATTSHILPPVTWSSGSSVTCHLWKGFLSGIEGNYIHAYGHEGQFLGAVELGGQN